MKWVFLVVILAVQGRKRRKLVCTTDSDIRDCVTGNVQLVNQARRDMNDFMNVLNNTIIPTFEKTTADALRQAEELKPLAKEIYRKNERLSLRMDKISSDHQERKQELQDLKEAIRENKASCLATSKNVKEEITKTEIAIAEKIKKINEEITEKEKDFQLALEKATAKVENENEKLLQSFEKLDQSAEIRSLENQLTKFDNKFSRENETIKKKLEKHNRRVSEKTEEALEKVRGQMQDVDDKISAEKLLLDLQIEQLTEAIQGNGFKQTKRALKT
ncbi:Oidioi.mRNA.OKI2018_I69.PAR.g10130.t1.cds [Oikopleura dioica]|uniref:Oidioi.mRNA.OKI2018_I69.PAR.g10130.t1.cds n=1 Tax=Oikopleura dioica TaxID=34765 RepID=A0ABN7RPY4_OIKDI|nr:Oidioi.mRNA.OKI2018_I69.PAR.g10130.t1.cds [Oikopleura dioica]